MSDFQEGAAYRVRYLLNNPGLMRKMGEASREHVRRNFLITRHLRDYPSLPAHLTACEVGQMNPVLRWIITRTTATALARQCPKCQRAQIVEEISKS